MTVHHYKGAALAAAWALALVVITSPVQAAAVDLTQATLHPNEVPAGYTAPVVKTYSHAVTKMSANGFECVTSTGSGGGKGMRQGLIQALTASDPLGALGVCAYLLDSVPHAHALYQLDVSGWSDGGVAQRIAIKGKLGDEAYAARDDSTEIAGRKVVTYVLYVRHKAVVVKLEVDQPPKGFTASTLVHLGAVLNGRLP